MTLKHLLQLIWCLWLIEPLVATSPSLAKPGCKDTCGNNVTIPYPFGIGRECFLDEWYEVVCRNNRPYLKNYSEREEFGAEVLDVSLDDLSVAVIADNTKVRVCEDGEHIQLASNLSGTPFSYEYNNEAMLVGCGTVMLSWRRSIRAGIQSITRELNRSSTLGCTPTSCDHQNKRFDATCKNGVNCCKFDLGATGAQHLNLRVSSDSESTDNLCVSVLFGTYESKYSSIYSPDPSEEDLLGVSKTVVLLRWWIAEGMRSEVDFQKDPNCYFLTSIGGIVCNCPTGSRGTPYLLNGCQVSAPKSEKNKILLAVGVTSFGILFLATACFWLYKIIRKRIERKLKEKFFKRNGGLLLQQQLSVDENLVDKVRLFTSNELDKATDNFNQSRVLGQGGQGTVYKGMLADGKIVAIKRSKLADENQVEQFINEVVVLSHINHRNVVKLLGCCLETEVPLLVYEFISNGTLYDLIHNESDEFLMTWDMRLRIGTEVSGALAYLHSATSFPIYHRDIKSSNILLDEKYKAKVSDFGISRLVTIDQTHLTTMVKGTFGYLDPEYFRSNKFTEKSDVYSFGVVLVELLTRKKPISSNHSKVEGRLGLAAWFLASMEEDELNMVLDNQIMDLASEKQVEAVAILAQRCLILDGRKRPTMKEVAMELESIKISHLFPMVQTNSQESKDVEMELVIFSDGISTSRTADDITESSSGAYPLLPNTF